MKIVCYWYEKLVRVWTVRRVRVQVDELMKEDLKYILWRKDRNYGEFLQL